MGAIEKAEPPSGRRPRPTIAARMMRKARTGPQRDKDQPRLAFSGFIEEWYSTSER